MRCMCLSVCTLQCLSICLSVHYYLYVKPIEHYLIENFTTDIFVYKIKIS